MTDQNQATERLHKFMARAGIASRRASEKLITQGRVKVNGKIITELGYKIDPNRDQVRVDEETVRLSNTPPIYIIFHKPKFVVSSTVQETRRKCILDFVQVEERVYPIGRLDFESEGLMLVSNDGDLAQRLTHPSYGHEREYEVLVKGQPDAQTLYRWAEGGFVVDGKKVGKMIVKPMSSAGPGWLKIIMREGRKRQIRVIAEELGYPVHTLRRVRFGPIKLGNLKPGAWRHLSPREVDRLKHAVRSRKSKKYSKS